MYKIIIQTLTAPQREGHLQSSASTLDDMSVGPILCSSYSGNCCCSEQVQHPCHVQMTAFHSVLLIL